MKKYVCDVCGYIYDEEIGDPECGNHQCKQNAEKQ